MSACRNVVVAGVRCVGRQGQEDLERMCKRSMTQMSLVGTMNRQCSGICGEASYWGKRLTLAERGRNGRFFKNKLC